MSEAPSKPKRKRRLFSFSLRALLIAMLLLACFFGWVGIRYRRALEQQAILGRMNASGWTIHNEFFPTSWYLFFNGNYISRIETILFVDSSKTTIDIKALAPLKNLESFHLDNTQVSDLTPLAGLTSLEDLYLDNTQVSDLSPLAGLTNLRHLSLHYTQVTQEQINTLQNALPNCKIAWTPPDKTIQGK